MTVPGLVPKPTTIHHRAGTTTVPEVISVCADLPLTRWSTRALEDWLGAPVRAVPAGTPAWFRVARSDDLPEGAYRLLVDDAVVLTASSAAGVINALHTLRQLAGPEAFAPAPMPRAEPLRLASVLVEDEPRFAFRGVHLDVARHFVPKAELLRFIDNAAAHKLNAVHLHLTDDQGWRIEIPAFGRLTSTGGWRADTTIASGPAGPRLKGRPHGGFYTANDLREIVAFARERGVVVIPEIDVPGHSVAAIAAYPRLGVDAPTVDVWTGWGVHDCILDPSDFTLNFYRQVLDTVMDIFDAPVIHLGGDEVPYDRWEGSATVRRRAADLGFDSVEPLHGWFLGRLVEHIAARGRRAGVWHEAVSPSLPTTAVVNAWGGTDTVSHCLRAGYDTTISCCSHLYLDYRENDAPEEPSACGPVLSTQKLYEFDALPPAVLAAAADGGARVTGIQAQIWTEYLDTEEIRDYHSYPRLSAFAELAWSTERSYPDFLGRLRGDHLDRLAAAGIGYRPLQGPLPWQQRPDVRAICGR